MPDGFCGIHALAIALGLEDSIFARTLILMSYELNGA